MGKGGEWEEPLHLIQSRGCTDPLPAPNSQAHRSGRPTSGRGRREGLCPWGTCTAENVVMSFQTCEPRGTFQLRPLQVPSEPADKRWGILLWGRPAQVRNPGFQTGKVTYTHWKNNLHKYIIHLFQCTPQVSNVKMNFKIVFKHSESLQKISYTVFTPKNFPEVEMGTKTTASNNETAGRGPGLQVMDMDSSRRAEELALWTTPPDRALGQRPLFSNRTVHDMMCQEEFSSSDRNSACR